MASRNSRARKILVTLCLMLVVCIASVGGTIAWLTDQTQPVVNTFSPTDIGITLTETFNTDTNSDNTPDAWTAALIPGMDYFKNPVVSVDAAKTNVDIYLFVKFEVLNNTIGDTDAPVLQFTSLLDETSGWTELTGVDGVNNVWYREVAAGATENSWHLLQDDKVIVNSALTEENMPLAANTPKITYTAYAIQKDGFGTAALAWAGLNP